MANEHIARKQIMGMGKESTAGTAVSASVWVPTNDREMKPVAEKALDESAYGVIDERYESKSARNLTEVMMSGVLRDEFIGLLLLAAFGTEYLCIATTMSGGSGTFTVGETVSQATSGATGTVRRVEGSNVWIQVSSGTFTSGSNTVTGGSSGATGTPTYDSAIRDHIFVRSNTNNHQSLTLYKSDDIGVQRAAYGMLESMDLNVKAGDYALFDVKFKAKKSESSSGTPSFNTENPFMAKHATLKMASAISGLAAASATAVSSFKMSISKNLEVYQAFGDDDIASIHNKQFGIAGDLEALYSADTLRDYVIDSTKRAMRLEMENDEVTIGSAAHPKLTIDFAKASFEEWSNKAGNNDIVKQTMGFTAEYSNDDAYTAVAVLRNDRTTAY